MAHYLHWILFLPLFAAAFSALFLRRQGAIAAWFSTATAFTIAGLALKVLLIGGDVTWHIELAKFGDISLGFGYLLDASRCALLDRDGYTTFVATAHPMRDPSPDELRALDVAGVGGLL